MHVLTYQYGPAFVPRREEWGRLGGTGSFPRCAWKHHDKMSDVAPGLSLYVGSLVCGHAQDIQ